MSAPTVQLTAAQVAFYHREGYLVLPCLTTPEEVRHLAAIYDHHFAARSGRAEGRQFDLFGNDADPDKPNVPQILGLSTFAPEVKESLLYANVRSALTQIFGVEQVTLGDHAIRKPPRCASATPWHQDEAYWDARMDYCSASAWVPLQDVDERNGCMHFVPRSHWEEVLPHRSAGGDPSVHGLELDGDFSEMLANAVACPIPAGGCTIHHNRTLHYATANHSDDARRAWIFGGGLPPRRRVQPRSAPWEEAKRTARGERAKAFAEAQQSKQKQLV